MDNPSNELRIVPGEQLAVRDDTVTPFDVVGYDWKPVQNADIFDFFKRFCEAGDMELETAGSLKGGKFIWVLARFGSKFTLKGKAGMPDETRGYVLLSSPHQYGFSLTAALTPIRVVCWNTISAALGANLDGTGGSNSARFRMVHSRAFDSEVKAQAEVALGLAQKGFDAFGHSAEFLSQSRARDDDVVSYFHDVLKIEKPEDDTEAAAAEDDARVNRNLKLLIETLPTQPGAELFAGSWWNAFNSVTYAVDHQIGARSDDNRLFNSWFGTKAAVKRRSLELALEYAKIAA
jgi:phage/plasmid-like protein (TIGR03299 family)